MRKANWWVGVSLGVALGLGGVVGVEAATDDASAQSGFTVSAEQLKINQRISQAAVRRSNESLDLLDPVRKSGASDDAPGWGTTQIRNGAVTAAKLDTATREGLPRWAVVAATTGALTRAKGATTSAKLAAPGLYTVTFDRDVSACALQATISDGGTTPITTDGEAAAWRSATDPKVVTVRTSDSSAVAPNPVNTLPFTVSVLC
jgi:hypothetical protein